MEHKYIELRVCIKAPLDYDCDYPFDILLDANQRDDIEIEDAVKVDEYEA